VDAAVLRLVPPHLLGAGDVAHVDDVQAPIGARGLSLPERGEGIEAEHLVAHEDVPPVPPGGVGPAHESGAAVLGDLLVQRVEVVLEL
jgi:hypothetical protein